MGAHRAASIVSSVQGTWAHSFLLTNVSWLCHQVCSQEDIHVISRRAVFNLPSPFFSLISSFPSQY